jgi:hypothetical protein
VRSGVFERLIENWLTNVNELGFQIPFCEMLLTRGYRVLHISRHSRGEHGKDVVARAADGRLWTFQMKGGDITFSQWRNELRGQAEDLVRLPVLLPGVDSNEPHTPVLVTNGELRGDAVDSVRQYADVWERAGSGRLEVWQGPQLLAMFVEAHGSFLPARLAEFRQFVELYVASGEDRLPRADFARFLERLVEPELTGRKMTEIKRGIESMVLMGSYILEQYERVENHIAAAEGWTVIAATILHVAEREKLAEERYSASLELARVGLERNLARLESEALSRTNFVQSAVVIVDPFIYGVRVGLVLGWLCGFALLRRRRGEHVDRWRDLVSTVKREGPAMKLSGEVDWPAWVALALFLQREMGSNEPEAMLERWVRWLIRANRGEQSRGVPNPYWLHENVLTWYAGELPKHEEETFAGQSYTVLSALDMLVRRLRRQSVRHLWPEASQMHLADFRPDQPADWFRWRCKEGETLLVDPEQPRSWSAWREEVCKPVHTLLPESLTKHPDWILPFALTYPHRMNRLYTRFVDQAFR